MELISTDLAGKVLHANVRNVIAKVQNGGRLTAGEIKIFEQYSTEQSGLIAARQSALIRKWATGGRLTDEEKEEISTILPLEPESRKSKGRLRFRLEQKEYAKIYDTSDRTIKRWIKTGKDAGDLPPLDLPEKMTEWWTRNYTQKVPNCILYAAKKVTPVTTPVASEQPPVQRTEVTSVGTGFREMLERVKRAEADAYRAYKIALDSGDESKLPHAQKTWNELSKQLRELERDAHNILSQSGELIEKSLVEKVISEIHVPIVNGLRSMWRRVKPQILAAAESNQDRVWQDEVDRLLSRLNSTSFTAYE